MQFIKMLKNTFKFDLSFQALKEVEQRRGKIVWVGGEKTEKKQQEEYELPLVLLFCIYFSANAIKWKRFYSSQSICFPKKIKYLFLNEKNKTKKHRNNGDQIVGVKHLKALLLIWAWRKYRSGWWIRKKRGNTIQRWVWANTNRL